MPSANAARVENHIVDILNAAEGGFGTAVTDLRRSPNPSDPADNAVRAARIEAGMEVLRAIARNPRNSYFGSLAVLVTVNHNQFLPAHDGEIGVPLIVPFAGADAREGYPADPDEIDSWRSAGTLYTGALDGTAVPHDEADADGRMSPVAGRYALTNGRFKFTGHSAQVPVIQLTRTMADSGVPEVYEPTLVKLAIPKLVKEGDNLAQIVALYAQAGLQDLMEIQDGRTTVSPVPTIVQAQKEII